MRTTLNFDDHLFREAKECAAREGETLTRLIAPYRLELLTTEGRPTPGVNFDDRDALHEWMEGRG